MGRAGRPDMAYFGFTNKLIKGETIKIFNYGNCKRDFTYIDDIVEGIVRVMQKAPDRSTGNDGLPVPPYAVYNIGNGHPENLLDFVTILQEELVRAGVLPEVMTLRRIRNWFRCSRVMFRSPMLIRVLWRMISAIVRVHPCVKGYVGSPSGMRVSITLPIRNNFYQKIRKGQENA